MRNSIARSLVAISLSLSSAFGVAAPVAAVTLEGCPASSVNPGIASYRQVYRDRGITLCWGLDAGGVIQSWVQVVHFDAGAKMRIVSGVPADIGAPGARFSKRDVHGWFDWAIGNVNDPSARDRLFSVANGGFLSDGWPNLDTRLSYPLKKWNSVMTPGYQPDDTEKRAVAFGDPRFGNQTVRITCGSEEPGTNPCGALPRNEGWEPDGTNDLATWQHWLRNDFDALVSQHPHSPIGADENRTYIGTRTSDGLWSSPQTRAYLMVTYLQITNVEATQILTNDFRTMFNLQLDGGGSSSIRTRDFGHYCTALDWPETGECRTLPNVLAVFVN